MGQTPKQVKFSDLVEELDVLIIRLLDEPNISQAVSRLFRLSRRHEAIPWEAILPKLMKAIAERLDLNPEVLF